MVLFVLVIMLLNAGRETPSERSRMARWLGVPLLAVLMAEILFVIWQQFPPETTRYAAAMEGTPAAIGAALFRQYVLPFEVTSILILVAILGAVTLAKKQR